jgi:CO/xanthine dehydrogenase FAD-binding subunit
VCPSRGREVDGGLGIYLRPGEIDEAVRALAAGPLAVLAGGTDFYPARVGRKVAEDVLDITGIAALRGIVEAADHFRLGAATTWSELIAAELPPCFDALKRAAREVGGVQVQNAGTLAGNLCNASPAADGVPCLLALDAALELVSRAGTRTVPLVEFITGNRRTARRRDELVTAIVVPKPRHAARSTFLKLGARRYLVISIAMVAAVLETEAGRIAAARLAVGACSAVAQRLPEAERALTAQKFAPGLGALVHEAHLAMLAPIDDIRGAAAYRREAALVLVRRALEELAA